MDGGVIIDDELEKMEGDRKDDILAAQIEMGRNFVEKLRARLRDMALERSAAESRVWSFTTLSMDMRFTRRLVY